ncbi:MAG TPA: hypothetical protein VJ103_00505 [Candidatus Paceibacterota bacterium]|nr:hypothetical protein [Candidatus Paceibacterota bacterium]
MKFKTKMLFLVGGLAFVIVIGLIVYLNFYLSNFQRNQTIANFRNLAELSEGAFFAFIESMEIRAIDWSSDSYIRMMTEKITDLSRAEDERKQAAEELGIYLREEKMQYDPSVVIIDILDKNGIVVASSRKDRIGVNEKKEEIELNAHHFSQAIAAGFGKAFVKNFVSEEDEHSESMMHTTTRIFSSRKDALDKLIPLDAVMLVHFAKNNDLNDILNGRFQEHKGALTGQALMDYYKTAEIYLVDQSKLMTTPSRFAGEAVLARTVDTLPVRACFEENRGIDEEYQNYAGYNVLGASMCLREHNLALIVEARADEVFAPIRKITNRLILSGLLAFLLSAIGIRLFAGILAEDLKKINERLNKTLNTLLEDSRK